MANPKIDLGEYELVDNQDGTATVRQPSTGEEFTIDGGDITDVDSVSTDDATLNDTATSPSAAGEFRLNGTDIEAYTGGGVKNLSNIGSGGGGESEAQTYLTSDNGTDGAAIQTALDSAANDAGPSKVIIDPIGADAPYSVGTNAPLTVPGDTTVIIREDIQLAGSTSENVFESADYTNGTNNQVFVFRNGVVDGNRANQTSGSDGNVQNCIGVRGEDILIINPQLTGAAWHGINVKGGSDGVKILGGLITDCYGAGVQAHWDTNDESEFRDLTIDGLTARNCAQNASAALWISGGTNIDIDNTLVEATGAGNRGILLTNGDASTGLNEVSVNATVRDAGAVGVGVESSSLSTGTGITDVDVSARVVNATDDGIFIESGNDLVRDVRVDGFHVEDSGNNSDTSGVRVTRDASDVDGTHDIQISNGTIRNQTGRGVSVEYDDLCVNTIVENVTVDGCSDRGIYMSGDGGRVTNCTIQNCDRDGIAIADPNHLVGDCTAKNNGQTETAAGLLLSGGECVVVGNRFYDDQGTATQDYGIEFSDTGNNSVTGNVLVGNGTGASTGTVASSTVTTANVPTL